MAEHNYEGFVDLNHKPKKNELIACYRIEPAKGVSIKRAAGAVAAESSVGTWTFVPGLKLAQVKKIAATVFSIEKEFVQISYPLDNFEKGSMPQIFSSIAGNVFGMKALNNLRLIDAQWPRELVKSFPGPQFGINGIQKLFEKKHEPIISCVPKPKVGMNSKEHAKIGYDIWTGGVDLLKDDENLTSQPFNKFENRVMECLKQREKAEKETGEKKACLFNVTAPYNEMIKRAEFVSEAGNEYVMVDLLTAGWSAVQSLREECDDLKLALYAHRAFHSAFTRNKKHGATMLFIAEAARLCGVENIHIGTVIGKLEGSKEDVLAIHDHIRLQSVKENKELHLLGEEWHGIKPVMSTSSGGLHPGLIPQIIKLLGKDISIQVGGGIHGHPNGSNAGAKAVAQAVHAALEKTPLTEFAKTHKELQIALNHWGFLKPR